MPGRKFAAGNDYRYGFNGKENDKDITSDDYDFGARIYDGRIGRWYSLDPLMNKYPNESNYAFVSNSPILYQDAAGRDKVVTIISLNKDGTTTTIRMVDKNYFKIHEVKGTFATAYQDRTHKESIAITFTLDFRGSSPSLANYSVQAYDINTNYTWDQKLSDFAKSVFTDKPREYGLTMSGGGGGVSPAAQLEWDSNLPKAKYSDYIGSVETLLEAASAYGDIAEIKPGASDLIEMTM